MWRDDSELPEEADSSGGSGGGGGGCVDVVALPEVGRFYRRHKTTVRATISTKLLIVLYSRISPDDDDDDDDGDNDTADSVALNLSVSRSSAEKRAK